MTRERDDYAGGRDDGVGPACQRVRGRLEELHDGGLPPTDEARDQGHLEACAGCRAESEAYAALVGSVAEALAAPGLEEALASSLAGFERALPTRPPATGLAHRMGWMAGPLHRRRGALLAAAAALLCAFLLDQAGLPAGWSAVSSLEEVPTLPRVGELPGWDEFLGSEPGAAR